MMLLVDIGNSRLKWAFGAAAGFVSQGEARHGENAGMQPLLESPWAPDEIRIANVAGCEAGARVAASLEERFRISPVFAGSAVTGAGVRNGYTVTEQLGIDRWLAICAAFANYRAPICVVDSGTATTVDFVAGSGEHQGGLILPGMHLMQSALLRGTGDLARLAGSIDGPGADASSVGQPSGPAGRAIMLGRDSASAIRFGALQSTSSLLRNCMEAFTTSSAPGSQAPILVLTGGGGPALQATMHSVAAARDGQDLTGFRIEYRPQLVLEGLAIDPVCFRVVDGPV